MGSLLVVIASLSLKSFNHSLQITKRVIQCVLTFLLIGNIAAIPGNRSVLWNGYMAKSFARTPRLLQGLRRLNDPSFVPAPDIRANPIYRHFQEERL
jgi:hypothetical protein